MEPQIRYVKSADGTRIGYFTLGMGRPLVYVTNLGFSAPIQVLQQIPAVRENIERLAQSRMVVLYDHGGQGFSQRDVSDFSLEARLLDLEAVSDRLDASQIDLFGVTLTSMIPITYAARHPEKVAHLLLYEAAASGREYHLTPERRALNALIEVNWELYVQAVTLLEFGWTELGRRVANARTDVVPENFSWPSSLPTGSTMCLPFCLE